MSAIVPELAMIAVLVGCGGTPDRTGADLQVLDLVERYAQREGLSDDPDAELGDNSQPNVVFLRPAEIVSYFFRVESGARLSIDRLIRSGDKRNELQIFIQPDQGEPMLLGGFRESQKETSIPLESWVGLVVRLDFAVDHHTDGPLDWWSMQTPRVEFPQPIAVREDLRRRDGDPLGRQKPNVIIYLADALRRDSLGAYGAADGLTPSIDRFSARATVYEMARAHSSWTRPSVASIFTGLEPQSHGVHDRRDSLPPQATTLAEYLSAAGYFTGAVITNGNVGPAFGMMQGFDYLSRARDHGRDLSSTATTTRALDFFSSPEFEEPFFLYVHNLDPHYPYEVVDPARSAEYPFELDPEELLKKVRRRSKAPLTQREQDALKWLYDEEVNGMDQEFGRLMQRVMEIGFFEDAVVIFLSDHGEGFWEHGVWGHGFSLYQEEVDIPLIVKTPGQTAGNRVSGGVRQVDIFASIAEHAGISVPPSIAGRPLPLEGEAENRISLSALDLGGRIGIAVADSEWKLIAFGENGQKKELYHVAADPLEMHDLANERPIVMGFMMTLLHEAEESSSATAFEAVEGEIDDELRENLEAIGYLQ